ncbi:hypothetical protein QR680_007973 [Steinernema hermaphroditum]|uniref:Uncharacterized protein n=1 Tax=Steinernema hermaphroditum TaxID=289476 RepID=A0AA39IGA6_9BILA|nr:hypothetical protein QR680_007973 [Steinernema hermaphroditum]
MSDQSYETIYNRVLDVTAVIHVPLKIFTVLIMIRHTPPEMKYLSYLLLDGMLWNLVANIIFIFIHLTPMFPAECLRADGIIRYFANNEFLYHALFLAVFYCIMNCGIAMASAFYYRYIIFAFPQRASKIKLSCIVVYHVIVHLGVLPPFCFVYIQWIEPYSAYPLRDELPPPSGLFCFKPFGWGKNLTVLLFLLAIAFLLISALISAVLLLRSIEKKKTVMHQSLLDRHRKIIWTFLAIMSVPIVFGAIPLIVGIVTVLYPSLPYARWIGTVCIVLLANHGALQAILMIIAVIPYREGALGIIRRMFCCRRNRVDPR